MDIREQLARDLLGGPYGQLSQQKRSVIDLIADQKPSGLAPVLDHDKPGPLGETLADKVAQVGASSGVILP